MTTMKRLLKRKLLAVIFWCSMLPMAQSFVYETAYTQRVLDGLLRQRALQKVDSFLPYSSITLFHGHPYLYMSSDSDVEDLLNGETPSGAESSNTTAAEVEDVVGIGGQDGVVYDVNRLKRNLVQETVRAYKRELWELLGSPTSSEEEIEAKVSALVQSNPVSTTTDSNLLDGLWSYAFGSTQAASDLLDPNRYTTTSEKSRDEAKKVKTWRLRTKTSDGPFRATTRRYNLEDLHDEEGAYVVDTARHFGGLFTKKRRYNVQGLTRTSLHLDIAQSQTNVCGKRLWKREYAQNRKPMDIHVLYLDGDLCVSTAQGLEGSPFHIYTKSDAWVAPTAQVKRKVRFSMAALKSLLPTRRAKQGDSSNEKAPASMILEQQSDATTVKMIRLGDLSTEDDAWEGEDDPFVHLSADERQEKIKNMNLKDIEREKQTQERRKKKQKRRPMFQRKKPFKKPDES